MGYPTAYRGGRSLQRGRPIAIPADPPLNPGPWMGAALFAYTAYWLGQTVSGWQFNSTTRQTPAGYGWTLTFDCGLPQIRLPAGARNSCGTSIFTPAAWATDSQNPQTALTLYYYPNTINGYFNTVNPIVNIAARWDRGAFGRPFGAITYSPRPGVLLGGPLPVQARRILGMSQAGYDAPAIPVPGILPGFDVLDGRWDIYWDGTRPGVGPIVRPDIRPIPRPIARAVPATGMREIKFNPASRAGRMFFAMYAAFNLLGDAFGFTRAIWRAIPKSQRIRGTGGLKTRTRGRGKSQRLDNMLRDIWENHDLIDPIEWRRNLAMWKLQDTVYGGVQGSMFNAIASSYGYPLARIWSTLDSEINSDYSIQRLQRSQESQRGG